MFSYYLKFYLCPDLLGILIQRDLKALGCSIAKGPWGPKELQNITYADNKKSPAFQIGQIGHISS